MSAFLAWAFSGIGRTVLKWAGLAAAALAVIWKIYDAGRTAELTKQQKQDLEDLRRRNTIDDQVAATPDPRIRGELARWVRD